MRPSITATLVILTKFALVPFCLGGYNGGRSEGHWRGSGGNRHVGGYSRSFTKVGPSVSGSLGDQSWSGGHSRPASNNYGGWQSSAGPKNGYGEVWRPYHFGYRTNAHDSTTSREERTDQHGRVTGYYSLMTADGRNRKVSYVADEHGFRAKVDTNEPGTASENPASVHFRSTAPKVVYPQTSGGSWRPSGGWSGGQSGGAHAGWQVSTDVNHGGWNVDRSHGGW